MILSLVILRRAAVILLVAYGACLSASGQKLEKNEAKPFLIDEIRSLLSSRLKTTQSDESFNKQLILEIEKRKVDFLLKADDEKDFRRLGANDSLIKAIKKGVPAARVKRLRFYDKLNVPYSKVTGNYENNKKLSDQEIKTTIKEGKKFLKLAGDDPEFEHHVAFVKLFLRKLEQRLADNQATR